ncbi:MAG: peptidoglycan DD-metalloendopeptidase family protein, partial [Gemmatimonadaceae bacterium]
MREIALAALALALALSPEAQAQGTSAASAQATERELRAQREEIDRVRREREMLEREALVLRNTAHELSDEVANLDRRVEATAGLVRSIDRQLTLISGQVETASANMEKAESEFLLRKVTLEQRVVDVYKRGPMFTVEAMLSAHSFGELVARYKYLHDLTLRDRALVKRVEELRNQVANDRDRLVTLQVQLNRSRSDRSREEEKLRELEREQSSNLRVVQQQTKRTEARIARLKKTEADMQNALALLEAARKRAESSRSPATRAAAASSAIKTTEYGRLDWPVDGTLVYTFGKAHWKGIGISAVEGTPVKSVAAGKVMMVRPLGTYGLTVFLDHGGGDYTIYGSLKTAGVKEGQVIAKGDMVGRTGVSDPDLPAHLHFEIRTGGREAV